MPGLSPDLNAMQQGQQAGQSAAQGMMPSAMNPMGSPQAVDPAYATCQQVVDVVNKLSAYLKQLGDEQSSYQVAQCAVKIQGVCLQRQKDLASRLSALSGA